MVKTLGIKDFAKLFGTAIADFDKETRTFIAKTDFRYRDLGKKERDEIILNVLKRIDSGTMKKAGKNGKCRWERGWAENLESFLKKDYQLQELIPKYVRPNQPLRLYQEYVMPFSPQIELDIFTVLRLCFFKKYLKNIKVIYEFGCGTGYNLALLSKLFPEKELHGLDWAKSAVKILNLLREKLEMKVTGHLFDMFSPDYKLEIAPGAAVITIGGLEQLGKNHQAFMNFLLAKQPALSIHIEPILELYDENNLVDYLAMKFHKERNYLMNFLRALRKLEKEGKVKVVKATRVPFGSLFHDGWSIVIWKPIKNKK